MSEYLTVRYHCNSRKLSITAYDAQNRNIIRTSTNDYFYSTLINKGRVLRGWSNILKYIGLDFAT